MFAGSKLTKIIFYNKRRNIHKSLTWKRFLMPLILFIGNLKPTFFSGNMILHLKGQDENSVEENICK